MGKRGPPKTPTAILGARGSWRAKARKGEPEALGLPQRPAWLDPIGTRVWEQLLPLLVRQSCASEIDAPLLGLLCHHYSTFLQAKELADVADPGTTEWARLHAAINAASTHIEKLSGRFGLTPADRAGVRIEKTDTPKNDGTARFFEGTN